MVDDGIALIMLLFIGIVRGAAIVMTTQLAPRSNLPEKFSSSFEIELRVLSLPHQIATAYHYAANTH